MRKFVIAAAALAALCGGAYASPRPAPPDGAEETEAAKEYTALRAEYDKANREYMDAYKAAQNDEERKAAAAKRPNPAQWSPKFKDVAAKHPKDPGAADCLAWIVQNDRTAATQAEALDALQANHLGSAAVARVCHPLEYSQAGNAVTFLRAVLANGQNHEAYGRACYTLARMLGARGANAARVKEDPEFRGQLEQWYGKAYVDEVNGADPAALAKESEALFERVASKFDDVKYGSQSLAAKAKGDLYEIRNLAVGMAAPEITGEDENGKAIKLSDFKGKVVLLDFWGFW